MPFVSEAHECHSEIEITLNHNLKLICLFCFVVLLKGCVEMGLGMIAAMRLFDTKRHEGVTMRVGIHTGTDIILFGFFSLFRHPEVYLF